MIIRATSRREERPVFVERREWLEGLHVLLQVGKEEPAFQKCTAWGRIAELAVRAQPTERGMDQESVSISSGSMACADRRAVLRTRGSAFGKADPGMAEGVWYSFVNQPT